MTFELAPIALFVYNRLQHLQQTVAALQGNELSRESELFIFSDAVKDKGDEEEVRRIRKYISAIDGFKSVTIVLREENFGLTKSIITGVTEIVNKYGKIIVLEDDLVISAFFLKFMNEALEFYEREERVISIHGYIYPVETNDVQTFFIRGADCLGWATWKRGWALFEPDGRKLLDELRRRRLTREFDIGGTYPYTRMLESQIKGRLESWAVLWYASAFLKDRLTLYPGQSFVRHIGNDGRGTNFGKSNSLDCEVTDTPIAINNIPIEENGLIYEKIRRYFKRLRPPFLRRTASKISDFLNKE